MAISVAFGNTDKRRNSTLVPGVGASYQCLLKDATSIITPTIQLYSESFPDYNYCYISEFHRYYFISDIVSESACIWNLSCEVDVLATYADEIKATPAFVMYAQSIGYPMIPDSRMPITDSFSSEAVATSAWPMYSDSGTYITSVISKGGSSGGFAKNYAMTTGELSALADRMLDPSILDAVKDYYLGQPADAVVGCTWIPVGSAYVGQGSSEITAFGNELGLSGTTAIPVVTGDVSVSVPLKYVDTETGSWQDYRNFEPYSKYLITLPGVGETDLPMISLASQQDGGTSVNIKCMYSLSTIDGVITWIITGGSGFKPVLTATGSLGTQMPVAGKSINIGGIIGAQATGTVGIAQLAVGLTTGNPLAMISGGATALASMTRAIQNNFSVSGSVGGRGVKDLNSKITVVRQSYLTSDTVSNVKDVIGRPYFGKAVLGSLTGLVKCTGACVRCQATAQEHQLIAQYVNCSDNYIYGGLIIE